MLVALMRLSRSVGVMWEGPVGFMGAVAWTRLGASTVQASAVQSTAAELATPALAADVIREDPVPCGVQRQGQRNLAARAPWPQHAWNSSAQGFRPVRRAWPMVSSRRALAKTQADLRHAFLAEVVLWLAGGL